MPTLQLTRGTTVWIAVYLVTMGGGVCLLWWARTSVLASLDDPAQRAQWQEWKEQEEARAMEGTSPVERRPPVSDEPPSLVLMRDSFPAVVCTSLILGTVLFAFSAIFVRGALVGHPGASSAEGAQQSDDGPLFARHTRE